MVKENFHILKYLPLLILLIVSCSRDNNEDPEPIESSEGTTKVSLSVRTVSTSDKSVSSGNTNGSREKIKSLRIIMLSDGFIEINTLINFNESDWDGSPNKSATDFKYLFERATVAGNKKFYLVANEESVKSVNFEDINLPEGFEPGMKLSEVLNYFIKDKLPSGGTLGYTDSGKGANFEEIMRSITFNLEDFGLNPNVYLPYTSVYEGIVATADPEITKELTMYLVPAATKFTINFKNYRREDARVAKFELKHFNESNYLMARLIDKEVKKTFNNKEYYWIDWLAVVGANSQNASDLQEFNKKAGWIEGYKLPTDNALNEKVFVPQKSTDWVVPGLVDKDDPSTLIMTFYCPESINMVKKTLYNEETNQYEEVDAQGYYARFTLSDADDAENGVEPEWLEIDTVNSLFRNTHVVVNVEMYESIVEIYCEVSPWDFKKTFLGYLQEDDD